MLVCSKMGPSVSLLSSVEAVFGFFLSVFLSSSAASVGHMAGEAPGQPLVLRASEMGQQIRWYSWQQE